MYTMPDKQRFLLICALLAITAFAAFERVCYNDFVSYDDEEYVTKNPNVQAGLTLKSIKWAFTESHFFMWHPVTSLSHMLDCQLFDLKPSCHHLVSLILHIANTLLLLCIFRTMTGRLGPSAFIAAAFALHPLNVESVAWVAERKTVVSGLFWMLTIAAYIRYVNRRCIANYLLVALVFSLALMSKPTTVTLPFVLLLLDYWPLNRADIHLAGKINWRIWPSLIWEKIPFFVLSTILCAITIFVQKSGGVLNEYLPFTVRLSNALVSYVSYIGKMIYPSHLAVFYPHPGLGLPSWQPMLSFLILAAVSAAVIYLGRRRPYLVTGWFWFLGTLVPVIGLVQAGSQAMADRYAYLSLIGLFIIVAYGAADLFKNRQYRKIVLSIFSITVILALSVVTRVQTGYWRNSQTLFEHALKVTRGNYIACYNLGLVSMQQNKLDEALAQFQHAIQIKSDYADAYNNIGSAYGRLNRLQDEAEAYKQAIKLNPQLVLAWCNLGVVYGKLGRVQDEIKAYRHATQLKPDSFQAYFYLGVTYDETGRFQEAADAFSQAIRINPYDAQTYQNLGAVCEKLGRYHDAGEAYKQAVRIKPDFAQAYNNLGLVFDRFRQFQEAAEAYNHAVEIKPDYADAYNNLGVALGKLGRFQESIQAFRQAIKLTPDFAEAHLGLGVVYFMSGNKNSALEEYEILKILDHQKADMLLSFINKQ